MAGWALLDSMLKPWVARLVKEHFAWLASLRPPVVPVVVGAAGGRSEEGLPIGRLALAYFACRTFRSTYRQARPKDCCAILVTRVKEHCPCQTVIGADQDRKVVPNLHL